MPNHYTISKLAREANVPTSTIRYYERRQLLQADTRSGGNYRLYSESSLERLRFIRSAQEVGFTLTDIADLLRIRDGDIAPCNQVQTLIQARLDKVHEELDHLTEIEGLLQAWLKVCQEVCRTGQCGVLKGLAPPKNKKI